MHHISPVTDCIPDADGRRCIHCGWEWKLYPKPWPRKNCLKAPGRVPLTPEQPEQIVANLRKRLAFEILTNLTPGGWERFGGGGTVVKKLAACAECEHLTPGGCGCESRRCDQWPSLLERLAEPGECGAFSASPPA